MLPFIILYSILGNVLYVHIPYKVTQGIVCFGNNTDITLDKNCHHMNVDKINNVTLVFSYQMKNEEMISDYFKILYYYKNNTLFDSNWIEKKNSNDSNLILISNEYNPFNQISIILNLILNIFMSSILTSFAIILYRYKIK